LCAIEAATGGSDVLRLPAIFCFVMGVISTAGVWALGLSRRDSAPVFTGVSEPEWMDTIK
jgi:hypothetical protein